MKTFTYVAAIALLTAGTAFAQAQSQSGAAGMNGSTINNSTPTPAAKGAAEGAPRTSTGTSSGTMMNHSGSGMSSSTNSSGSMGSSSMGSSSMNQSSDINHTSGKAAKHASKSTTRMHHVASARGSGNDAKENRETEQLNRQQVAGGTSMAPGGMNGSSGMNSSGAGNPFNNGSPQQAQGGGANCTPDNPSCGTARQNPAIQSSPEHRTYPNQQR